MRMPPIFNPDSGWFLVSCCGIAGAFVSLSIGFVSGWIPTQVRVGFLWLRRRLVPKPRLDSLLKSAHRKEK